MGLFWIKSPPEVSKNLPLKKHPKTAMLRHQQLGAMLQKTGYLKRRNVCMTCCEICSPILLMFILVLG